MATVCCRALYAVRWYEVSRVLSVSSTLVTTKNYRNETWCKRWWHISQRNLFLTTSCFAPGLSPILAKEVEGSKTKTVSKDLKPSRLSQDDKAPKSLDAQNAVDTDGVRIGSNNTIESLLEDDFRLIINNNEYLVQPPLHQTYTMDNMQKLSDVQTLVCQLYEAFHVREHYADMEKQVLAELEAVRLELEPLEQQLQELETTATRKANIFIWVCLVLMSVQFSGLARLTWWEYSWDIMEPVTYFVTYGTTMACFIYFLLTKQEYMLPDVLNRRRLIALHKRAKQLGLDLNHYNSLKDRAYELETTLKIIRGPLYDHKNKIEQKKRERSSSSSSSSSRSPSSSPSPSPSPERSLPKKGIFPEKDTSKKPVNEETRFSSNRTHKEPRDY
ncbi:mitochondrial calcium uniporter isoform X2 [Megachile rotundata]|uniref:mitochondrial calcium uniporter isoform X2 n=1 Tax=Megachile rotundata TaxID=143995 RepID=UPI003FD2D5D2